MQRWIRHVGLVLGLAGIVLMGRGLLDLLAGRIYEMRHGAQFDRSLRDAPPPAILPAIRNPYHPGSLIGRLEIPRIGLSTLAVEGDSAAELRLGAGRLPQSRLPGEGGNMVFAGHRDTVFRVLSEVRPGDRVALRTPQGAYRYVVQWSQVVAPTDLAVLGPTDQPSLTLVTCYPFNYIGAAPERFIVRAKLEEKLPTSPAMAIETAMLDRPVPAPPHKRRTVRMAETKAAAADPPDAAEPADDLPAGAASVAAASASSATSPASVSAANPPGDPPAEQELQQPEKRSRFARLDPWGLFHKVAHVVRHRKAQ